MTDAAAGDCPIGESDGPLQHATAPRLLADASNNTSLAADLRLPFACLTSRLMHNVARRRSATLLQENPQENWNNQLDCPITNTVYNDEALTSGGERFVSSTNNPEHSTHDLGLGKAIVVHSARFERTTFGSASQRSIQLSYECIPGKQMLPRPNYKVHWIIPDRLLL